MAITVEVRLARALHLFPSSFTCSVADTMAGPVLFYQFTLCAFALLLLEVKGRGEGVCSTLTSACGDCSYACAPSKVRRLCSCVTGTFDEFYKLYVTKARSG